MEKKADREKKRQRDGERETEMGIRRPKSWNFKSDLGVGTLYNMTAYINHPSNPEPVFLWVPRLLCAIKSEWACFTLCCFDALMCHVGLHKTRRSRPSKPVSFVSAGTTTVHCATKRG